jgi:cytochrome c6
MLKKLAIVLLLVLGLNLIYPINSPAALAVDLTQGEQVFQKNCAPCHAGGGNVMRWWKNLKLNTLKNNKLDSEEAIAHLVTNGKNSMSAYKDRLTEEEIKNVSAYVLQQAKNNWR